MIIDEVLKFYDENYDLAVAICHNKTTAVHNLLTNEKFQDGILAISDSYERCRFCGKTKTDGATFKKIAHSIPECIGNKLIRSTNNECDTCNKVFSGYESDFSKYLLPHLPLNNVKGKKGYAKQKYKGTIIDNKDGEVLLSYVSSDSTNPVDVKSDSIEFSTVRQPHRPIKVYKTMLKMALSTMPFELFKDFKYLISYLFDTTHHKCGLETILQSFYPTTTAPLSIFAYSRKKEVEIFREGYRPAYIFAFLFGDCMFQIYLPNESDMKKLNNTSFDIHMRPIPFQCPNDKLQIPNYMRIDLSSSDLVKDDEIRFTMGFDEIIETSINEADSD